MSIDDKLITWTLIFLSFQKTTKKVAVVSVVNKNIDSKLDICHGVRIWRIISHQIKSNNNNS